MEMEQPHTILCFRLHTSLFVVKEDPSILSSVVWHFDEPLADPAAIPTYLLSQKAKKYVSVVLTGDGGDELFAGYEQYPLLMKSEKIINLKTIRNIQFRKIIGNSR